MQNKNLLKSRINISRRPRDGGAGAQNFQKNDCFPVRMFPRQHVCLLSICMQSDPVIAIMSTKWWVGVFRYTKQDFFMAEPYAHIWSGSPRYLSSVHDRYPAIYVDDHIWKCTAGLFSRLVQAAILKSEAVLAVFSRTFNIHKKNFPRLNALKKSTSICFSLQGYPEVDLEFSW